MTGINKEESVIIGGDESNTDLNSIMSEAISATAGGYQRGNSGKIDF